MQNTDLVVLCKAVEIAASKGAFSPDQFAVIGGAYNVTLEYLKSEQEKAEKSQNVQNSQSSADDHVNE